MKPTGAADESSPNEPLSIVVIGSGPLALELLRLGRAAGHEMLGLSSAGRPRSDEPWVHGVEWASASTSDRLVDHLTGRDVAVVAPDAGGHPAVRKALAALETGERPRRMVWMSDASSSAPPPDEFAETAVLELPELDNTADELAEPTESGEPDGAVPTAQVAMAALRTAVEPDRTGHYGPSEISELGRAMMLQ